MVGPKTVSLQPQGLGAVQQLCKFPLTVRSRRHAPTHGVPQGLLLCDLMSLETAIDANESSLMQYGYRPIINFPSIHSVQDVTCCLSSSPSDPAIHSHSEQQLHCPLSP